ncbi:ribosome maturation factor RimP [Erysipelothrix urinaevulpis]|uniref:ribosome maturation factor RimP n=1 Tax=Erysipelothrix urinaevulpis TaxID=2683717 RepID=UPI00135C4F5B|nr:ribosome assembly cofactor RimP [Erysipelothrix urinaevulpis]
MEKYLEVLVDVAHQMGLEIVDVEFVNNDLMALRIAHQDFQAISLDTCVDASRAFGEAIDFEISLDVSSAGAEREIEADDFHTLTEQYVLVKFKNPFQGADYVEGTVVHVDDEMMRLSYQVMHRFKEADIPLNNISMCRLAVKV